MRIGLTGQSSALSAVVRTGLAALGLVATLALAACTTVEGTNALTDFGTFEREVMNTTARGVGLIPGEPPKPEPTSARAPLVLPKGNADLPAPTTATAAGQLPANSNTVRIDTANLTEQDIINLRNARVVDARSVAGRPLTEAEMRQLTARLQQNNMAVTANTQRPLYLPPEQYFTRIGDAQMVCRAANGDIVSINDNRCPADIRRQLQSRGPSGVGISTATPGARLTDDETKL